MKWMPKTTEEKTYRYVASICCGKNKYTPQVVHSIEYISRITYKDIFRQIEIESLPPTGTQ